LHKSSIDDQSCQPMGGENNLWILTKLFRGSIYLIQKRVMHEIMLACKNFLWTGRAEEKTITLVVWDSM